MTHSSTDSWGHDCSLAVHAVYSDADQINFNGSGRLQGCTAVWLPYRSESVAKLRRPYDRGQTLERVRERAVGRGGGWGVKRENLGLGLGGGG